MLNRLCNPMPYVSRFTFHVLLFAVAIGYPQGFASSEMALIPAGSVSDGER